MIHRLLGVFLNTLPVHSLEKLLGYWGCGAHTKVCSDPLPLVFSFSVKKNYLTTISPVKMLHMRYLKIILLSHQGSFHCNGGHGKNILSLGKGFNYLDFFL